MTGEESGIELGGLTIGSGETVFHFGTRWLARAPAEAGGVAGCKRSYVLNGRRGSVGSRCRRCCRRS